MNIAQKTVLITGANRGIGRALVTEALRRGAKRVYAGTRGSLDIADERVTPLILDVTIAEQIQQAVSQVGSLDVLINNSGIAPYDDLSNPAVIEQALAVNFFGMYKVSRAFLPKLKRSNGAIVNNLSLMALAPLPLTPSYAISKAAALSMTQSLRALSSAMQSAVSYPSLTSSGCAYRRMEVSISPECMSSCMVVSRCAADRASFQSCPVGKSAIRLPWVFASWTTLLSA